MHHLTLSSNNARIPFVAVLLITLLSPATSLFAVLGPNPNQPGTFIGASNQLWVQGRNQYGQQGTNNTGGSQYNDTAYLLTDNVRKVVATNSSTLVLFNDGTLWGTGFNGSGQLGIGTSANQPQLIQIDSNVVDMAAGYNHSVWVRSDGTMFGSGNSSTGQIGLSSSMIPVQIDTNVKDVVCGGNTTLYIKNDDSFWGLGSNDNGQLGQLPTTAFFTAPFQIDSNVSSASGGDSFTAYIKNNSLWVAGVNTSGQLGTGNNNSLSTFTSIDTNVDQVTCGIAHMFYLKNDNTLWATGLDSSGQLGDGAGDSTTNTPIQIDSGVLKLANYARNTTLYIKNDNTLWGSGQNTFWDLGAATPNTSVFTPIQLQTNVSEASGGGQHAAFLKASPSPSTISRSLQTNTVTANSWTIDSQNQLGSNPTFIVNGVLPTGLQVSGGQLLGTISQEGTYNVSISGQSGSIFVNFTFTIIVGNSSQTISAQSYSFSVTTNTHTLNSWSLDPYGLLGGQGSYTVDGLLPYGLSINGNNLSGFVPNTGIYRFAVVGTNDTDASPQVRTEFEINCLNPTIPPMFTSVTYNGVTTPTTLVEQGSHGVAPRTELLSFNLSIGMPVSFSFTWDFIKDPFIYTVVQGDGNTRLPGGLSMDNETGIISGTPIESGEFFALVSVMDWRSRGYQWLHLVVE
jgi:alpha-tubulin suppressor-like RCC1 family protein